MSAGAGGVDPVKVLFVGDTHANLNWTRFVIDSAKRLDADVIVQVGDFGYWEHTEHGRKFLDAVNEALAEADLDLIWIDGNHENHTVLRLNYGPGGNFHDPTPDGFWRIRERVFHAPRGSRWTWHGRRFLACGGAYSIDRNWRRPGESWWPEETIDDEDVRRCIEGGQADVMVTHDTPAGVRGHMGWATAGDKDNYPESMANRTQLRKVFDVAMPTLLVHGHYHHRNTTRLGGCRIEGLARDDDGESMLLVDLADDLGHIDHETPIVDRRESTTTSGLVVVESADVVNDESRSDETPASVPVGPDHQ
jgi:Icc-related predicted phosphoesterase